MKVVCSCIFCLSFLCLQAQIVPEVLINEINLGDRNAYVEILVVGDLTRQHETINLSGFTIDNLSAEQSADDYFLLLGTCLQGMKQGSLILIYDDVHPHTAIDPTMDGQPNGQGVFQIPLSDPCISVCAFSDPTECDGRLDTMSWRGVLPIQKQADVLQLKDAQSDLVNAVNWAGEAFEDDQDEWTVQVDRPAGPGNVRFALGGGDKEYESNICAALGTMGPTAVSSPGDVNGAGNAGMIDTIRTGNHPRILSLDCTMDEQSSTGAVTINIANGELPFTLGLPGTGLEDYELQEREFTYSGLENDRYIAEVTDVNGCKARCPFEIKVARDSIDFCEGSCVTIGKEDEGYCYTWTPTPPGYSAPFPASVEVCPTDDISYTLDISYNGEALDKIVYDLRKTQLEVSLLPDDLEILICDGEPFYLTVAVPLASDDLEYIWSTGDNGRRIYIDPMAADFREGDYMVQVRRRSDGCRGSAQVEIYIQE